MMRIAGIQRDSIVDGYGLRDVIFFQGCPHRCKGCHNPSTWGYAEGKLTTVFDIMEELKDSHNDITISGGEPFSQYESLCSLVRVIREDTPKRVWLYTGHYVTQLDFHLFEPVYKYVDVVIDGRYREDMRDTNLLFRGSSNQRIIDVQKSLERDELTLWEESR